MRARLIRLAVALVALYCVSSVAFAETYHIGAGNEDRQGEWTVTDPCSAHTGVCQFAFTLGCDAYVLVWKGDQSWLFERGKRCPPNPPVLEQ